MNVILISLYHYDNYALRLLYAYLRKNNVPTIYVAFKRMKQKVTSTLKNDYVEMHDYHDELTEDDINALLNQLEELNPCLVGISLQSTHFQLAKKLTSIIKNKFNIPILWGGSHPTIAPEDCIKHTDIICRGEGFDALLELYQKINQGQDYKDIRNLWFNGGNKIIRNNPRPFIDNLDILPFASFDGENKIYIDEGKIQKDKNIDYFGFGFTDTPLKVVHQTMASYGCPMRCSFCINALPYDKFRLRSPSHIIEELVKTKQENKYLKMVFFWDNILSVNKKWCFEFAKLYREKISLPFFTYSHPLFTDMEVWTALRKAGWSITVMGIQSGSQRLRKTLYNRNETNEHVLEACRKLNRLKYIKSPRKYFRIYYDYVKNNPLEGKEDLRNSLNLFLNLPKGFIFQAFNLSFFPNYLITKYFLEKGYISEKDIEGNVTATSASHWITTFDSKKEYHGFLRRHEYYYLLFSLAQFKIFPNFLIRIIERNKIFYANLSILYYICRIVRVIDLTCHISNYFWLWELARLIPLKFKIKNKVLARYK